VSSVVLVQPAKAVVMNEVPFDRDTHVAPSNIVLDRPSSLLMRRGDLGDTDPRFAVMLPIAKLLWLLFYFRLLPVTIYFCLQV